MYYFRISDIALENAQKLIRQFQMLTMSIVVSYIPEHYNVFCEHLTYDSLSKILYYINEHFSKNDFYEIIIK